MGDTRLVRAVESLAGLLAGNLAGELEMLAELIEAKSKRPYYYDTVNEKAWVLGSGGRSGNCEICVDNSDEGWVEDGSVYEGVFGDVDGPPAHPNCDCELEYRERRFRVYY